MKRIALGLLIVGSLLNGGIGVEITSKSGLKYIDEKIGEGENPKKGDIIVVHYTGTLEDGSKFDSSRDRGQPFEFPIGMGRVIKGWEEGLATMKTGGKRKGNKGYFFEPTVLTDVPTDAKIMNDEPFGPLAPISPFDSFDSVVEEANRLNYGLAAFAFTNSAKTAEKISSSIESGIVSVNQPWMPVVEVPFGGIKDSGYGKELGTEGLEAYMTSKFITQKSSI